MGEFLDTFKNEARSLLSNKQSLFLRNKKNLISLLVLGILILGLLVGIRLIREQQIIKSRATADPIIFTGDNIVNLPGNRKGFKLDADGKAIVELELTSPLGPPAPLPSGTGPASSPGPSSSPNPSSSPSPSSSI